MKKNYIKYLSLILLMILFTPSKTLAENELYEYIDFKAAKTIGENINKTDVKIYASKSSDTEKIIDCTDEFNIIEKKWNVCDDNCENTENVTDEMVFEEGKNYILMVKVSSKNEIDLNNLKIDRIEYNGTPIKELSGKFSNVDNELSIETRTTIINIPKEEEILEPKEEEIKEETKENQCLLGLSICCTTFLNLSICIWILIAIAIILLIIIICALINKKRIDDQLSQL